MGGIFTIISAVFQVVLLLLKAHYSKEADAKKLHADNANKISDAIGSGDIARINGVVQLLRGKTPNT